VTHDATDYFPEYILSAPDFTTAATRNANLPPLPDLDLPESYPPSFRWDDVPMVNPKTGQNVRIRFVKDPPLDQIFGMCWYFSAMDAMSAIASYHSVIDGWETGSYDPWPGYLVPEDEVLDFGFHLSPVQAFQCDECTPAGCRENGQPEEQCEALDMAGTLNARGIGHVEVCVDPYRPYGDTSPYDRSEANLVELPMRHCADVPNPPDSCNGLCGTCTHYFAFDYANPAYPAYDLCSNVQKHFSEPVFYEFGESYRLDPYDLSLPTPLDRWPDVDQVAGAIYKFGPLKYCSGFLSGHCEAIIGYELTGRLVCTQDNSVCRPAYRLLFLNNYDDRPGHTKLTWVDASSVNPQSVAPQYFGEFTVFTFDTVHFPDHPDYQEVRGRISGYCDPDGDGIFGRPQYRAFHCNAPGTCRLQDNCPTDANRDQADTDGDGVGNACDPDGGGFFDDGDGDGLPANEDNCPAVYNPQQLDLEGDGIGDACDPDRDGDGYADEKDCEPNLAALGLDLDMDGVCDRYQSKHADPAEAEQACLAECLGLADTYGLTRGDCEAKCAPESLDNCMEVEDPDCARWFPCKMVGRPCGDADGDVHDRESAACRGKYANPDQMDSDGNGIGDRCEERVTLSVRSLSVQQGPGSPGAVYGGPMGSAIVTRHEDAAEVRFGATYETGIDNAPEELVRTGSQVGACGCDRLDPDGRWNETCSDNNLGPCPKDSERDSFRNFAWNPIRASECTDEAMGNHAEPGVRAQVSELNLCYRRRLAFRRNGAVPYRFTWRWTEDVRFEHWNEAMDWWPRIQSGAKLKVRVAWPGDQEIPSQDEKAFSEEFAFTDPNETSQELHWPNCILMHQMVITLIPGMLDKVAPMSRPAYFLSSDGETAMLFGLDAAGARLAGVWRLPDPGLEGAAGAAGQIDRSLVGLGEGQVSAAYIYQPGTPGVAVASASAGEPAAPGPPRLLALIETAEGDAQVADLAEHLDRDLPRLQSPDLAPLADGRGVVLLGRPDGLDVLTAWRADLRSGRLAGPFPLPAVQGEVAATWSAGSIWLVGTQATGLQVWRLDPEGLWTTAYRARETDAGRPVLTNLSVTLEERTNSLLVAGQTPSAAGTQIWRFHLADRTWEHVADTEGADRGLLVVRPGPEGLWWMPALNRPIAEPLPLDLIEAGSVQSLELLAVATPNEWPATVTVGPARPLELGWMGPADEAWPGRASWVEAVADEPVALTAEVAHQALVGPSRAEPDGTRVAAFTCPPAETCTVRLEAPTWTQVTVDRKAAALAEPESLNLPGRERDLLAAGRGVLVATSHGLFHVAGGPNGLQVENSLQGPTWRGLQSVVRCGRAFCLSRLRRRRGLRRFVLRPDGALEPAGAIRTQGLGWDLAARGGRVYVAEGTFGIGIYDASSAELAEVDRLDLFPPLPILAVAVAGNRLYGATPSGLVYVWNLSDLDEAPDSLSLVPGIVRLRFLGRHLLVLGHGGAYFGVYHVSGSSPELVWETWDGARRRFTSQDSHLARYWLREGRLVRAAYVPEE